MTNPNQLNRVQQLEHRLAIILEEAILLRRFVDDRCHDGVTLLNNIEIACDLTDDESLSWTFRPQRLTDEA
jgi:hypothetical protein